MARTISYTEELVVEVCWCGMHHAIPKHLSSTARRTGQGVCCPLGHTWVVTESELDRAKQRAAALTAELDQERARANAAISRENQLREEAAKAKKRAAAGVCACCKRSFQNVNRHMRNQHPDFTP
jgi:hypothetical protein